VVILGEDGKAARAGGAKDKGKGKERDWEETLDVEDAKGEEAEEEDMEVDKESDRESEEV
jgi:hypothetical protein